MANFEVSIGADNSELNKKIKEAEFDLKELSKVKIEQIKLGLDTKEIDGNIKDVKKSLNDLKSTLKDTGTSFDKVAPKVANGGNALTQFGRIAQDAPFGIMGIGNNITATAEAFGHLAKESGGAGGALKAVGASLMGPGGILLAVSLVTTALTVMSQQGLTVSDVFDKMTGRFDEFKKSMSEVNAEATKTGSEQGSMIKGFVSAAQNVELSMRDRLIAVKKLQDEYPAYFGNLSKEHILNGNVASAVKAATEALIAKAKAQGFANKVAELAEKEVPLREQETKAIEAQHMAVKTLDRAKWEEANNSTDRSRQQLAAAKGNLRIANEQVKSIQEGIISLQKEQGKWQEQVNKNISISIPTEFKPPTLKKEKLIKELHDQLKAINMKPILELDQPAAVDPFATLTASMEASRAKFIERLKSLAGETKTVLLEWNTVLSSGLGDIGTSIGDALANGTNVLAAVGSSLLSSIGSLLSSIGDKLITVGVTAVLAGQAIATMFTPVGIAAGLAAIAGGVALKAGGSLLGSTAKKMTGGAAGKPNVSAGNSVSSPTSSTNNSGGSSGFQNVVFEISGQSLVGVLSNTLNKNVRLGGVPAI